MGAFLDDLRKYKKMLLLQKENEGSSEHTCREYASTVGSFLDYIADIERVEKKEVSPADVNEFFLHGYLSWRSKYSKKEKGISQSTKREYMVIIKSFLRFVTKKSAKQYDFLAVLEEWKVKAESKQRKSLTEEQNKMLLDYMDLLEGTTDVKDLQKLLILKILYYTGVRAFELRFLKKSDFIKSKDDLYSIKVFGKGQKEDWTYIKRSKVEHELKHLPYTYICETRFKKPMSHVWLWKLVKRIFEEAGFDKTGVHIMRHHFAMMLIDKNTSLTTVQELLRHSDIKTTQIYAKSNENAKKAALERAFG